MVPSHNMQIMALAFMHQDFPWLPESFQQYYELWMVKVVDGWLPKFFAIKTKPLVDAPFILNLDNLTCYQLNC